MLLATSGSINTEGRLELSAESESTVMTRADGSNTGSAATGVGIAVGIGVADVYTTAQIGGAVNIQASTLNLSAISIAGSSFSVEATSGAAGEADSVAGALAINVGMSTVLAELQSGANILLSSGLDPVITADNRIANIALATASQDGGDTGVGASVALNIGETSTVAAIADSAIINGADDLTRTRSYLPEIAGLRTRNSRVLPVVQHCGRVLVL